MNPFSATPHRWHKWQVANRDEVRLGLFIIAFSGFGCVALVIALEIARS